MDELALTIGYGVGSWVGAVAIICVCVASSLRWPAVGNTFKVLFLLFWGSSVTIAPAWAIVLAFQKGNGWSTLAASLLLLIIPGAAFYYIGWPALRRTISHVA